MTTYYCLVCKTCGWHTSHDVGDSSRHAGVAYLGTPTECHFVPATGAWFLAEQLHLANGHEVFAYTTEYEDEGREWARQRETPFVSPLEGTEHRELADFFNIEVEVRPLVVGSPKVTCCRHIPPCRPPETFPVDQGCRCPEMGMDVDRDLCAVCDDQRGFTRFGDTEIEMVRCAHPGALVKIER